MKDVLTLRLSRTGLYLMAPFLFFVLSGHTPGKETATISGRLLDSASGKPAAYVLVNLNKDTRSISLTYSDDSGYYNLQAPPGVYSLVFSATGYNTHTLENIVLSSREKKTVNYKMQRKSAEPDIKRGDSSPELAEKVPARTTGVLPSGSSSPPAGATPSFRGSNTDGLGYFKDGLKIGGVTLPGTSPEPVKKEPSIRPGMLTAGELNDYKKWKLWEDLGLNEFNAYSRSWGLYARNRYCVQLTNSKGMPVTDAVVTLTDKKGNTHWTARTDNTGKAELWSGLTDTTAAKQQLSININYKKQSWNISSARSFQEGMNSMRLPVDCDDKTDIDIAFVVDATGSMGDEIQYLKTELLDVMNRFRDQRSDMNTRLGCVFYRDIGDQYVTRMQPLSGSFTQTTGYINRQSAGGGGDIPEAVDSALSVAIHQMAWSDDACARIIFLVLDASPHKEKAENVRKLIAEAAAKGIRIIPVASSGILKETEFLMRTLALATNGSYVFLTDHSGVGNSHIAPSTDTYEVEYLNDLLLRLLLNYTETVTCTKREPRVQVETKPHAPDTVVSTRVINLAWLDTVLRHIPNNIPDKPFPGVSKPKPRGGSGGNGSGSGTGTGTQPGGGVITPGSPGREGRETFRESTETDENPEVVTDTMTLTVFPNPSSGMINIRLDHEGGLIYIADVSGKLLRRMEVKNESEMKLDISDLASGTYIVQYVNYGYSVSAQLLLVH